MHNMRHVIPVFENVIGLVKRFLNVALPYLSEMGDICAGLRIKPRNNFIVSEIRMNEYRIWLERFKGVLKDWKWLVLYLDQA